MFRFLFPIFYQTIYLTPLCLNCFADVFPEPLIYGTCFNGFQGLLYNLTGCFSNHRSKAYNKNSEATFCLILFKSFHFAKNDSITSDDPSKRSFSPVF